MFSKYKGEYGISISAPLVSILQCAGNTDEKETKGAELLPETNQYLTITALKSWMETFNIRKGELNIHVGKLI